MTVKGMCCKGTLAKKRASYAGTRKGYHLIVNGVLAWVCEQCGGPLFDEETVDAIQEVLREVDRAVENLGGLVGGGTRDRALWPDRRLS
jgi:YgiT-type zinc finger domain-containing protein